MSKIISFTNQKGGSGSSTLALVLAAPLATEYRLKIAILDCDYQQSIIKTRKQIDAPSLELLQQTDTAATYPYDVFPLVLDKVFDFIDDPANEYDLIILDLPNRLDSNDVFNALTACDVVIVPLVSSFLDLATTADFMNILKVIKTVADERGFPFDYFGLATKWVADQDEKQSMNEYIDGLGISRFNSYLSNHAAYTRASTLFSLLTLDYRSYAGGSAGTSEEIRRVCTELIERVGLPNRTAPLLSLTARQQHELQQH
jgi:chromosome partitioning protein